jgi:hypothetical protein
VAELIKGGVHPVFAAATSSWQLSIKAAMRSRVSERETHEVSARTTDDARKCGECEGAVDVWCETCGHQADARRDGDSILGRHGVSLIGASGLSVPGAVAGKWL